MGSQLRRPLAFGGRVSSFQFQFSGLDGALVGLLLGIRTAGSAGLTAGAGGAPGGLGLGEAVERVVAAGVLLIQAVEIFIMHAEKIVLIVLVLQFAGIQNHPIAFFILGIFQPPGGLRIEVADGRKHGRDEIIEGGNGRSLLPRIKEAATGFIFFARRGFSFFV